MMDMTLVPRRRDLPYRVMDEQAYVVYTDDHATSLVTLNATATAVWQAMDGCQSIGEILAWLEASFESLAPATMQHEALAFIAQLVREGLVVLEPRSLAPADSAGRA